MKAVFKSLQMDSPYNQNDPTVGALLIKGLDQAAGKLTYELSATRGFHTTNAFNIAAGVDPQRIHEIDLQRRQTATERVAEIKNSAAILGIVPTKTNVVAFPAPTGCGRTLG